MTECYVAGIRVLLPKPQTPTSQARGQVGKCGFIDEPDSDTYRCPAGQTPIGRFTTAEKGQTPHCYWSSARTRCALKARCTSSAPRRVKRWEHEAVLETMQQRLDRDPNLIQIRRQTAEHPFDTLKAWMGSTHFLMRRFNNVRTEMSLHVSPYNLKRVM